MSFRVIDNVEKYLHQVMYNCISSGLKSFCHWLILIGMTIYHIPTYRKYMEEIISFWRSLILIIIECIIRSFRLWMACKGNCYWKFGCYIPDVQFCCELEFKLSGTGLQSDMYEANSMKLRKSHLWESRFHLNSNLIQRNEELRKFQFEKWTEREGVIFPYVNCS